MSEQGSLRFRPVPTETNEVAGKIVDAALEVHSVLGPGLLESVYQACLVHELVKRGLAVQTQAQLPIVYGGLRIESGLRLDVVVEDCVVVELKAVEEVLPIHQAQLLTYLRLSGMRVGLLLNFNVTRIKDGITRLVL